MNITKLSIENNRLSILIVVIIAFLGMLSYNQLSRDAMPTFTVRVCSIVTNFPGASPERVENLVSDKIEKVVQEIPELKTVTSESRTGISIVKVSLNDNVPEEELQDIWDRIRRKIDEIRAELPDNIKGPNVKDEGIGVVYGIQLGLTGDGFSFSELEDYADELRDDLIRLEEVARVEIDGLREEQIFIEFDNASMAKHNISTMQVSNAITYTNIVFPGGEVSLENERIVLEPTGNYEEVEDLKNTLVTSGSGQKIRLKDFARITKGYETPQNSIVKVNGEEGLVIAVNLKEGENLTNLGEKIDEKIEHYNSIYPHGIKLERISSQDYYINGTINSFVSNVLQSVIIVLLVMLLFLGVRTGLVVASLIPLTMLMTLMIMNFMDVGLNKVTLASLIMALGLLVDNSIVVSEAILVKITKGVKPKKAAISAAKELTVPLLISTLTTSAAFLAFFLSENVMGEMMGNIFIVITIALLSSWILALSFVAMLSMFFIKVKKKKGLPESDEQKEKQSLFEKLNKPYKNMLDWVMKRPWTFLAGLMGLFVGVLLLFPQLPFIFMPDSDRNMVIVDLNLPQGTKIEETEKVIDAISEFINSELLLDEFDDESKYGVQNFTSFISKGPNSYDLGYSQGQANSGYAHMLVNTSSLAANRTVIDAIEKFTFEHFPEAQVSVGPMGGAGGAKYDVSIRIAGADSDELMKISEEIKQKMAGHAMITNIQDDWGPMIKKVLIDIDQEKAARAGFSNQDIAVSLRSALSGFDVGDFRSLDGNIPIILKNENNEDINVLDLESINIFSQGSGKNVPLIQVADIDIEWQLAKINRRDLVRTMTINCDAAYGYTASEINDVMIPVLNEMEKDWESGYSYSLGGESETSTEALGAIMMNLPISFFIILLLLMLQFNSFRKTFIVLSSIPLGIIGVILGRLLFFEHIL